MLIIQINPAKTFYEQLGTVAYTCRPGTQETEAEDHEFKASLGYITRPRLKTEQNMFNVIFNTPSFHCTRIHVILPSTAWGHVCSVTTYKATATSGHVLSLPPAWLFKATQVL